MRMHALNNYDDAVEIVRAAVLDVDTHIAAVARSGMMKIDAIWWNFRCHGGGTIGTCEFSDCNNGSIDAGTWFVSRN